jgi:pyroglutamyl-peptidase
MQTILITGFDRFPGSPVNPSGIVAKRLARHRRPALAGTRRVGHVFATRYDAVDRELPALLTQEKPDIVVMFGVATGSRQVRIEERARNRISLFPDAGRRRPAAQTIALHHDARRNPLPIARLVTAARSAGVAATPSHNAGSYLCNYAYWRGLEAAARPDGPEVVFVHVPPVAVKPAPKKPAGKESAAKALPGRPLKKTIKRRSAGTPAGRPAKIGSKLANRPRRTARVDDLVRAGEAVVLAMTQLAPVKQTAPVTPLPVKPQTVAAPAQAAMPPEQKPAEPKPVAHEPAEQHVSPVFQTVRRWLQKLVGG